MANRILIEKEIKEFCKLNNIIDVAGFTTQCLLQGFNVIRYGSSPMDNVKRENNEVETIPKNREVKKIVDKDEPQIKVKKRKITIIKQ